MSEVAKRDAEANAFAELGRLMAPRDRGLEHILPACQSRGILAKVMTKTLMVYIQGHGCPAHPRAEYYRRMYALVRYDTHPVDVWEMVFPVIAPVLSIAGDVLEELDDYIAFREDFFEEDLLDRFGP